MFKNRGALKKATDFKKKRLNLKTEIELKINSFDHLIYCKNSLIKY